MKFKKNLRNLAITGLVYAGLWGGSQVIESQLPDPEDGRLAILIADPIKVQDSVGYAVPGAHDLYTSWVGLHFGRRPEVYRNARLDDIRDVLNDDTIDYVVVAGHGDWEKWSIKDEYSYKNRRFFRVKNSLQGLTQLSLTDFDLDALMDDDADPKTLFVRHTCGKGRSTQVMPVMRLDEVRLYVDEMKKLVPGKVAGISSRNEDDIVLLVRYGQELTSDDLDLLDPVMDDFFEDLRSREYNPFSLQRNNQFGTSVVHNEYYVRGWEMLTNPIVFMLNPIPAPNNIEIQLQKKVDKRDGKLAKHDYSVQDEWEFLKERNQEAYKDDSEVLDYVLDSAFKRIQDGTAEYY
jgi:hypothetical protein